MSNAQWNEDQAIGEKALREHKEHQRILEQENQGLRQSIAGHQRDIENLMRERNMARERGLSALAALRELVIWSENWLPDEAKDQGARCVIIRARELITRGNDI